MLGDIWHVHPADEDAARADEGPEPGHVVVHAPIPQCPLCRANACVQTLCPDTDAVVVHSRAAN